MKILWSLCIVHLYIISNGCGWVATRGQVWPIPQREITTSKVLNLDPKDFQFKVINVNCGLMTIALNRYMSIINETVLNHASDTDEGLSHSGLQELLVNLTQPCEQYPHHDMDENYVLTITETTTVLGSASIWGIMRGLESFTHLLYYSNDFKQLLLNTTHIEDFPRYKYRGLLLDTSRHYITVPVILKLLDGMCMNKMNVFHWHITDTQSFPYKSDKYPELSGKGAYDQSLVYTKQDIKTILDFATSCGIRIVPEFDIPGHTQSIVQSHPEVMIPECGGVGIVNPTRDATFDLLNGVIKELQGLFPETYFHLGGDEVPLSCWSENQEVMEYMKKHNLTSTELESEFFQKIMKGFTRETKVIVWQEAFQANVQLPKDAVIEVWSGSSLLNYVVNRDRLAIYASEYYLDHLGDTFDTFYKVDPIDRISNKSLVDHIFGGEACMWGEMVNDNNVLSRVWPRASAVAEVLWSARQTQVSNKISNDVRRRIEEHTCRMIRRGLPAEPPSGPGFCINLSK